MIFKNIHIKEGLNEKIFKFDKFSNLIFSEKNSCGKTTLIRFLLYSIGYQISSTKNIQFDKCEVDVEIYCENLGNVKLSRYSDNSIDLIIGDTIENYCLPMQQKELHNKIFGIKNNYLLENMLGTFYFDQDKGWTLLNRGKVIGSIHYSIEELLRGLSGADYKELLEQEKFLKKNIEKCKQILNIVKYKSTVEEKSGSVIFNDEEIEESKISKLNFEIGRLKKEIKDVKKIIKANEQFKRYVSEMKLLIKDRNGNIIQVTQDNIVGYEDSTLILKNRCRILNDDLNQLLRELNEIQNDGYQINDQMTLIEQENLVDTFDKKIVTIPVDEIYVKEESDRLRKALANVENQINNLTNQNNVIFDNLYAKTVQYLNELQVEDEKQIKPKYLFTSNLKELSGAVLHKTVFAFRLACLCILEENVGIKFPVILDSPSGKEVDEKNIQLMMNIVKRDFSDHQVIIASIYKYDFDNIHEIILKNNLLSGEN